ncbi:MAG TPA: glycosyltransferase family 2 protein [Nitrospira sp.]|nr:glycosyltransferase family 2 protein [Nitrospira sp.]
MIVAVVVTYQPDLAELGHLLDAIRHQVQRTIVVDNGSTIDVKSVLADRDDLGLHCLSLGKNQGVAAAQNAGIAWAREQGANFVILFDQDSIPEIGMVALLQRVYQRKMEEGYRVAAVGPRYVDERNCNRAVFSRLCGMRVLTEDGAGPNVGVLVDFVISSGSLISLETLSHIGCMTETLFIDQIDIDWGLRARSLGYQSFGVHNAVMTHSLGEAPLIIFGHKLLNHSPLRHYYIVRNAIWLIAQSYTPLGWQVYFARMILVRYLLYSVCVVPRLAYFTMMTKGLWHGLIGRMGKMES